MKNLKFIVLIGMLFTFMGSFAQEGKWEYSDMEMTPDPYKQLPPQQRVVVKQQVKEG